MGKDHRPSRCGRGEAAYPLCDQSRANGHADLPLQKLNRHALDLFCRFWMRSSTTVGSASVEISPRLEKSSSAILRRMRRMILPDRVLGRPGENWIWSGVASGPISFLTCVI